MSDERRAYTITKELREGRYRAILQEGLRHCSRFSLVQRRECIMDDCGESLLRALEPYLRNERFASEWPGTKLLNGTAVVREYELVEESAKILETAVHGLYEWSQPSRPEDLVLWRRDGEPWLVTIAHEHDAYFLLTPTEHDQLSRAVPTLDSELVHA